MPNKFFRRRRLIDISALKNNPDKDAFEENNKTRKYENLKSFCHAPFRSLYFNYNGNVIACCSNHKHILGNYPMQSINDIWHGHSIQRLREALQNYNLFSGCNACYEQLIEGNTHLIKSRDYEDLPIGNKYPVLLEFALSNTCNLECVMCDAELSSKIREREHLKPLISPYDEQFLIQLEAFIPHIKEAKFYGGEPFLIPIYYKIWDSIIRLNPTCNIDVQTNACILNDKIKALLSKGRFSITVSIDAASKQVFEKIRKNSSYETVTAHADYFQQYCKKKKTYFGYSFCPIRLNWQEIPAFISTANQKKVPVYFHTVWLPPDLALWTLQHEKLEEIYQFLNSFSPLLRTQLEKNNAEQYEQLKGFVLFWRDYYKVREKKRNEILNLDYGELESLIINRIINFNKTRKHNETDEKELIYHIEVLIKALSRISVIERSLLLQKLFLIPENIIVSILEHPSDDFVMRQLIQLTRS